MNGLKRLIALGSSAAMLTSLMSPMIPISTYAADSDVPVTVTASRSAQIRANANGYTIADNATVELRSDNADYGQKAFMGGLVFDLSGLDAEAEIESAVLVTTTERSKSGNKNISVKPMESGWSEDTSKIDNAAALDSSATITLEGQKNSAIFDNIGDVDTSKWNKQTDVTDYVLSAGEGGELNLLLVNERADSKEQQIIFGAEMSTAKYKNETRSNTAAERLGLARLEDDSDYDWNAVKPQLVITYKARATAEPSATPTIEVTAKPSPTSTIEVTAEPSPTPTVDVTAEPSPTPTIEVTAEPSPAPTAEPLPDGAVELAKQPSNVTTKQSFAADAYGNTRDAAYSTNNNSIWYIGTYDVSKIKSIKLRAAMVGKYTDDARTATPQIKIAYMPKSDTAVDNKYIADNNGAIRAASNIIAKVSGVTEPTADKLNGHKYLGAMFDIDASGVRADSEAYKVYPNGEVSLDIANCTPFDASKSKGEVELFIYATAQSCRAAMDYIIIEEKTEEEETPTPTQGTDDPTPTPTPTVKPEDPSVPENAIVIKDQPKAGQASTQSATVNSNSVKRDVAYSNGTGVWYLGTYELANIDSIDLRLGLVGSTDGSTLPQVKIGYVPADGKEINDDYVAANSSAIRSTANTLAVIEGETKPAANEANGHLWLGALYNVSETGITVDSAGYEAFPGGSASVGLGSSPLKTDAEGKVNLFVYTLATKCRATIDYVVVNEKVLTPTELNIVGEDTWVIRDNVKADYETSVDAYKAVLISDLGTEMKINEGEVIWSVSGSDYISMKSPSGAASTMTAETELPIGKHNITLTAEYENGDGVKLSASKSITVDKRESSVPKNITVSGPSKLDLLTAQLPYDAEFTSTVTDQFGVEMEDAVVTWTVSGDNTDGITIDGGKLTVGEKALSGVITITAASAADPSVTASYNAELIISEYPSYLYPAADVLFRSGNTDTKNVSGPDLEIRNLADSDRGFSGAVKFDISTLKAAIKAGYPINSVSIRFTTSLSNDNKLVLKPLSNDWDETNAALNSFENKQDIINDALNSTDVVVSNDDDGIFTLSRMTKGKRMYEGERGDTETVESWQTTLDITDYITKSIEANPDADEISFLLTPNYNGTSSNTVYTKDINNTYASYSALIEKFPELTENPELLYPAIIVDYGKETMTISAGVDTLPIPATDSVNKTQLSAVHYNPFTDKSDSDVSWSISGFVSANGSAAEAAGISIDENGILSVSKNAAAGTVKIRATAKSNKVVYAEKEIKITALGASAVNGSFENTDDAVMPVGWTVYDPDIADDHNGVQRYEMNQASEPMLYNVSKVNDDDGFLSGAHSAEDPTGVYGKRTVKITGAPGITRDYEGKAYVHNRANSSSDGGPDLRVTTGVSYWISQDYHLEALTQLTSSTAVGPYVEYEGFQGTTSKKSQFGETWYIKDGNVGTAYTTDGYDTLRKLITIPQNVNRLAMAWGLTGTEGSVYFHNYRIAPQGIDTTKNAVDGNNVLKVSGKLAWTSDGIAVVPGGEYTYKFSNMSETAGTGCVSIIFYDAEGTAVQIEKIDVDYSNKWIEKTGSVTAPENAAYAEIKLENGTGSGSTWYDNVIFTESSDPIAAYAAITSGNDMVIAPKSGETANEYMYTAKVTDQYNNEYSSAVVWSLDGDSEGITIDGGKLTVSGSAKAGQVTVKAESAENSSVYAEKLVTVIKKPETATSVDLKNSDFADYDSSTLYPAGWTNSDKEVSIANSSFDSSISGWRYNTTTYTSVDTAPEFTWDGEADHTGNSGGSAKIYNADRAQGSMQISQNLTIQGGNIYDISVWVKTDNVSDDSMVHGSLIFYDKNGSNIEENKQLLVFYPEGGSSGANTSDWTKLSGPIYASPNAAKLRIDLRFRGGQNNRCGTVWYDDLLISKRAGMDLNESYEGKPSLSLSGYGAEANDVSRGYGEKWDSDAIIGITSGQTYQFSANVKTFNADKGAYLTVTYYDEYGRMLSADKTDYLKTTDWQALKAVSSAPVNAAYAVMSLCIDGQGTAWFAQADFSASGNPITIPTEKPTEKPNTDSNGGGGGGGGSTSGGGGAALSGVNKNPSQSGVMGNFGLNANTPSSGNNGEVTTKPEQLLPQPDIDYFTQNLALIGGFKDIFDVPWAQKSIVALSTAGIVNGKDNGIFAPNDNITRAEFVKMLIGMLEYADKINTDGAECSFSDVPADAWYYEAVAAAVENGIVTGVSDSEFAPNANITRQDMAVMINRAVTAAKLGTASGAELIFEDAAAISDYAKDAVRAMTKAGIINGFDDGTFAPMDNATRAQAVVMIYRLAGGES